jgi:hypothetical protein
VVVHVFAFDGTACRFIGQDTTWYGKQAPSLFFMLCDPMESPIMPACLCIFKLEGASEVQFVYESLRIFC